MWTTQAGVAHRVHSSQQQTQKIATASIRSKEQPALPRCSELSSKHPQIPPRRQYKIEFIPPATKAIQDAGGKYVIQGGKTISFEGEPPAPRVVVFQFESMDKAQSWWNSQARKDADAIGDKYATFRVYAVEGASR
jgi:uncharacterized protein (DUF1330 family)